MNGILYATSIACDSIDKIGASAGDFGRHAVVLQFGCVTCDFPCFIDDWAVSAVCCVADVKTLSFVAEPCLLVLVRLVIIGVDGAVSGGCIYSVGIKISYQESMMVHCICHYGTVMVDVPVWLVEVSGSAMADCSRCSGSASSFPNN